MKSTCRIVRFRCNAEILLVAILSFILALAASDEAVADENASKPNIVLIYADDLGYGDLGCYGHPSIRTPHLDRMAREGMRFTNFYSAAEVCTPSRAALLTGRYPIRSGMCHDQFRVLRPRSKGALPASEVTIAELLRNHGYATGVIGKWHLGVWTINPQGHPSKHGFDHTFGLPHSNDMNRTASAPKDATSRLDQQAEWWNSPLFRNQELVEQPADQTTLTRRYTEEAIAFMKHNKERPFFLYFPHSFPHVPLFASDQFRGKSPAGLYGDVVEELDASVGSILETLRELKLDKKTLVVFSSDNGPWLIMRQAGGSAGLLREGKGSTWEGGMRVPGIFWWPGQIPENKVQQEIGTTMDVSATIAKLVGSEMPRDREIDGIDIRPLLFGNGNVERPPFFYYRGAQLFAVRSGPWKAHYVTRSAYGPDKAESHDPPLLYHLGEDPSERFNVAVEHPDVLRKLAIAVEQHRTTIKPVASQLIDTEP